MCANFVIKALHENETRSKCSFCARNRRNLFRTREETPSAPLDELDSAILRHLERHGRATNYEVGEAVGLSASAASRRILSLEKTGAIRGYRAQVDDRLLGKRMTVFIRVTLERQSAPVLAAFEAAIRRSRAIVSCHLMAGQYDYTLRRPCLRR